ncbi:MAG TPA: EF-P beta-lysylation protein EpmB [Steroidobacteraceae bacterium]
MIAASSKSDQTQRRGELGVLPKWQQLLADAIKDPHELCRELELDEATLAGALAAARDFPLRVPRSFVAKMRRGDPRDPLLLQVLPTLAELNPADGFIRDPVGDLDSRATRGLLHKYSGRALLVATGACAVHCRYCFRRHFPYDEESALFDNWRNVLEHLQADTSISEVILSGGDPLSLSDRRLRDLVERVQAIPHVRRLRIHTRYPIVLPERVDSAFVAWLADVSLQKVVVIHANHPRELDDAVQKALNDLRKAGVTLLNQSVLLAGVNDDATTLAELSERLFACGVLPYYLHLLDRVAGAAHFEVPECRASALHAELMAKLPGYLIPRLVREVPGAASKTPITSTGTSVSTSVS